MLESEKEQEVGGDIRLDAVSVLISRGYGGTTIPPREVVEQRLGKRATPAAVDRVLAELAELPDAADIFPGL